MLFLEWRAFGTQIIPRKNPGDRSGLDGVFPWYYFYILKN
jgi:hypothetical protein